jgi:guanylate kinase
MAKLFVISGISGSGKDSVINSLKGVGLDYTQVTTTTSRSMRSSESYGRPYYFVSEEEFKRMISENKFFEWAVVYDNYYGNTKEEVQRALETNKPVILKVDVQGAEMIKKKIPEAIVIFLSVSSPQIIETRLRKRGEDNEEIINRRLKEIENEMKTLDKWDYVVVNKQGKLKEAAKEVKNIIEQEFNKD